MKVFVGILALLALLFGLALWVRMTFLGSLAKHAEKIERSNSATYDEPSELPPVVRRYLDRVGIDEGRTATHAFFEQKGQMKLSPDGDWIDFTAEQWMAVDHSAFLWWPTMAMPVGSIVGTDRLDGDAQLEMRIFGVIPVAKDTSSGLIEGELARYLAELPWNPAALAGNRASSLGRRVLRIPRVRRGSRADPRRGLLGVARRSIHVLEGRDSGLGTQVKCSPIPRLLTLRTARRDTGRCSPRWRLRPGAVCPRRRAARRGGRRRDPGR